MRHGNGNGNGNGNVNPSTGDDRQMFRAMGRECVAFRARRASRLVTRLYDQKLAPLGLTSTQLTLLSAIANRPDFKSAELAELLGAEPSSLSRSLALLAKNKWVRVLSSAHDKREKLYELTPAGLDVARRAYALWQEAQDDMRDALGGTGALGELTASLDRIAERAPADR